MTTMKDVATFLGEHIFLMMGILFALIDLFEMATRIQHFFERVISAIWTFLRKTLVPLIFRGYLFWVSLTAILLMIVWPAVDAIVPLDLGYRSNGLAIKVLWYSWIILISTFWALVSLGLLAGLFRLLSIPKKGIVSSLSILIVVTEAVITAMT